MYCPNCRVEYRAGVTECADCGAPLVEELPPEPPEPAATVEVWAGSHNLLFDFLANALTQAGIEFHGRRDQSTYLFGSPSGFGPPFSLWVHRDEQAQARKIIEDCLQSFESEPGVEEDTGGVDSG